MGYESTLIFGTYVPPVKPRPSGTYVSVVATIDLSKMAYDGPFRDLLKASEPNTERLYVFYTNGDEEEYVDCYGEPFKVLDPHALVVALTEEAKSEYRRAILGLEIARAWEKAHHMFETAVVLHYGH